MKGNYNWVKWNKKDIQEYKKQYLEEIKKNIKNIKSIKSKDRTFKNTILALDYLGGKYHNLPNFLEVLTLLSPNEEIRQESMRVGSEINTKVQDLIRDKKLYNIILDFNRKVLEEKITLNVQEVILLRDTVKSFKKLGFGLNKKNEKKLKENIKRLNRIKLEFENNINEWKDFIEIEENDLIDLPENFRESLKKNKNGRYEISIEATQLMPFMNYSTNDKKRKELAIKSSKKGGKKNLDLLQEILKIRKENAKLLGYKNHGEFVLDDRMAKRPEVVEKFEWDLVKRLKGPALKDLKKIEEFKNKINKTKNKKISFFDLSYFVTKYELEKINFDEEKFREYFELKTVVDGMFNIFGNLFGIYFKKKNKKLWEKTAELFEVFDKKTKKKIGEIIFDFFPRDGKYNGAFNANIYFSNFNYSIEKFEKNSVVVATNFRKPTRKIPSLLSLRDMETLFHEFGHSLHQLLSKSKIPSQFGCSVKWDFVETPSQLLENWINQEKVLKKISRHWRTGKKIPIKMILSALESKKFMKAFYKMSEINSGILDLILYTEGHKKPEKLFRELNKKNGNYIENKESLFPASFGHLMDYDVAVYSYVWSLVFADDIFSEFEKNGIFDKKIGMRYRKEILEVGSSRDELLSVEKFLGRKSNNKAFLKKLR